MLKYLLAFACAYLIAITASVTYQVEKSQQAKYGIAIMSLRSAMEGNTGNRTSPPRLLLRTEPRQWRM